jgi:hypothetical protein
VNKGRIAGLVYTVTFVSGTIALVSPAVRTPANLIATASYVVVTLLFYDLFKPVSRTLSAIAAAISLAGLVWGMLNMFRLAPFTLSPLAFFGFYCVLIGYLILRSTFVPSWLGGLMIFGGIGWLTFGIPSASRALTPYNFAPGIFAEGVLTIWLLAAGVDMARWKEQARA